MAHKQEEREYDVLVWGATGFTGRLVAQYMAGRAKAAGLRWAVGGRSAARLAEVKRGLEATHGELDEVGVVTGDSTNAADMEAVARTTRAVISTVGPFTKYGTALVAACVKVGTHYADITGEAPWVRSLIDKYHAEAKEKGVCIVPMSGFDSIPADIGTFMLADYVAKARLPWAHVPFVAMQKYGAQLGAVEALVRLNGGLSGGTAASMMEMASQGSGGGNTRTWTNFFIMALVNTRVVRRSNALLGDAYGPNFHYNEYAKAKGLLMAILFTVALFIFGIMLRVRFTREHVLKKLLPAPGEGPSEEKRAKSNFRYELYGQVDYSKSEEQAEGRPKMVKAVVSGRDPGYTETAVMLSEVGIALAELSSRGELPVNPAVGSGGILTPASALGSQLVQRLQAAGLKLHVEDLH
ncbi:saccharopine dehydrogenase [Acanthamoeba castellanii str. Neff]|uniref:Saccharopine dehydrogenase n=1 Tax=Acanthamoeba castellanii (strain ATCC 30010 / Neff) TaxID=1257118 RepID=L8GLR5_ACACF|nr:saccharopine dehydrogenase [Acanthamoeba castellanii str. Neff]ELR13648.1 saccharopine dehydrogenase [Acanthamoeba castellanii str. Neff]